MINGDLTEPKILTQMIPLSIIDPSPLNPRRSTDPERISDMARLLQQNGQLQAIVVRPTGRRFEVICGHRRRLGAIEAGWETLRAEIRLDVDDIEATRMMLVENSAREPVDYLSEGDALQRLLAAGDTMADLEARLGHGPRWLKSRLALARLVPAGRDLLAKGQMGLAAAEILASTSLERQDEILEELQWHVRDGRRLTVDAIRGCVAQRLIEEACWDLADDTLGKPACDSCPTRSDRQPGLFDEDPRARCLDRQCWGAKEGVFFERMAKVGRAHKKPAHQVPGVERFLPYSLRSAGVTEEDWADITTVIPPEYCTAWNGLEPVWRLDLVAMELDRRGRTKEADALRPKSSTTTQVEKPKIISRAKLDESVRQLVESWCAAPTLDYAGALEQLLPTIIGNENCMPRRFVTRRMMIEAETGQLEPEHTPDTEIERFRMWLHLVLQPLAERALCSYRGYSADGLLVQMLQARGIEVPEHLVRE